MLWDSELRARARLQGNATTAAPLPARVGFMQFTHNRSTLGSTADDSAQTGTWTSQKQKLLDWDMSVSVNQQTEHV